MRFSRFLKEEYITTRYPSDRFKGIEGYGNPIFRNPTQREFREAADNAHGVRGLYRSGDTFIWNIDTLHHRVAPLLATDAKGFPSSGWANKYVIFTCDFLTQKLWLDEKHEKKANEIKKFLSQYKREIARYEVQTYRP